MAVRLRIVLLVAVVLIGIAAIVFEHLLALGPLRKIVVSSIVREGPGFWQIAIHDDDRYVYLHGAEETTGRIAFAPFAERLARVSEVRYLPPSRDIGPGLTFWVEGRRRTVQRFVALDSGDHAALRSFAAALHDAVAADTRRQDAPRIGALTSLHDLIAVEVVSNGCFGWCGVYDEILRRDGGELSWPERSGTKLRRAPPVAWERVVGALHAAHVERLDRKYPSRAIDTASATLRFVFPRVTYTVEAPDSSAWPPEFFAAFGALRHLGRDMAWSPALDAEQLRILGR
jgi:hypothetical protein